MRTTAWTLGSTVVRFCMDVTNALIGSDDMVERIGGTPVFECTDLTSPSRDEFLVWTGMVGRGWWVNGRIT